ncbi:MAG: hypothetical protein ACFHVJ_03745 [Aestuariibacter sp.]
MPDNYYSISNFIDFAIKHIWKATIIELVVILATIIWLLGLPDIYRSEVTIAPTEHAQGGGFSAGGLGGIASLAGLSLGEESVSQVTIATSVIQSRIFANSFIVKHEMAVPLVAAVEWDTEMEKLIIDPAKYDIEGSKWTRSVSPPRKQIPSDLELYEYYQNAIEIESKDNGLITISFEHISPILSAKWAGDIVDEINKVMREREVEKVSKNIQYLEEQAQKAQNVEIRASMYALIQDQYEKLMLAEANKEYIFYVIDPAIVPEMKDSPKRTFILVFVTLLVSFVVFCAYLIAFLFRPINNNKE